MKSTSKTTASITTATRADTCRRGPRRRLVHATVCAIVQPRARSRSSPSSDVSRSKRWRTSRFDSPSSNERTIGATANSRSPTSGFGSMTSHGSRSAASTLSPCRSWCRSTCSPCVGASAAIASSAASSSAARRSHRLRKLRKPTTPPRRPACGTARRPAARGAAATRSRRRAPRPASSRDSGVPGSQRSSNSASPVSSRASSRTAPSPSQSSQRVRLVLALAMRMDELEHDGRAVRESRARRVTGGALLVRLAERQGPALDRRLQVVHAATIALAGGYRIRSAPARPRLRRVPPPRLPPAVVGAVRLADRRRGVLHRTRLARVHARRFVTPRHRLPRAGDRAADDAVDRRCARGPDPAPNDDDRVRPLALRRRRNAGARRRDRPPHVHAVARPHAAQRARRRLLLPRRRRNRAARRSAGCVALGEQPDRRRALGLVHRRPRARGRPLLRDRVVRRLRARRRVVPRLSRADLAAQASRRAALRRRKGRFERSAAACATSRGSRGSGSRSRCSR